MVYDVIVIGAGVTGTTFASKIGKFANTLLIDDHKDVYSLPVKVNLMPEHNTPFFESINFES